MRILLLTNCSKWADESKSLGWKRCCIAFAVDDLSDSSRESNELQVVGLDKKALGGMSCGMGLSFRFLAEATLMLPAAQCRIDMNC